MNRDFATLNKRGGGEPLPTGRDVGIYGFHCTETLHERYFLSVPFTSTDDDVETAALLTYTKGYGGRQ